MIDVFSGGVHWQESGDVMRIVIHVARYDTYRDIYPNTLPYFIIFFSKEYDLEKNFLNIYRFFFTWIK